MTLLNCGFGEDSWESLGQQGDPTSPTSRKSVLIFIGRTDVNAEAPVLWLPDGKSSCCSLSRDQLFVTPWTAACQASLSFATFQSLLKLMSIELVMSSNNLILCHPLLFLPSIFRSIRVYSSESALRIRKRPWWRERLRAGREGDDKGWDGWKESLIQWTWVWANSRR